MYVTPSEHGTVTLPAVGAVGIALMVTVTSVRVVLSQVVVLFLEAA
jgi:hypothetical protein